MITNAIIEILNNYVDHFIICESKYDHKGNKKEINFELKNKQYEKKVRHLIIEKNFPDLSKEFVACDINKVDYANIPEYDVLCAGFPCQPFSQAGKRLGMKDPLNGTLFNSVLETIDKGKSKPRFLILENVPSILTLNDGVYWRKITRALTKRGYEIDWKILSPNKFGIPQIRRRVFLVGSLKGLTHFIWPKYKNGRRSGKPLDWHRRAKYKPILAFRSQLLRSARALGPRTTGGTAGARKHRGQARLLD